MAELRRLIAGNWKMNLLGAEAVALARGVSEALGGGRGLGADVALCPAFTALHAVSEVLAGTAIALGGQDCHEKPSGAFTGSISAPMLKDAGCRYVIVGHSERRQGLRETDALVAEKVIAAWQADLVPIVCVGETRAERETGQTLAKIARQVQESLIAVNGPLAVAYEPIWAIGTGLVPTAEDIAAAHRQVRAVLRTLSSDQAPKIPILYGGSVKADNAKAILDVEEVGGLLVGGASLEAKGFAAIVRAAG